MGGPSKPDLGPQPAAPQQIDYNALMASAAKASAASYKDQLAAQIAAYPKLEALQLGTVNKISAKLNDAYTGQAKGIIDQTLQQGATALTDTGNRINALGDQSSAVATAAQQRALGGPSSIEQALYNQTASDLALGSRLNPEEERAASQQASNAFAMRGLGTGNSAAAADLLNRYSYGQARLGQRQQAASSANQMMEAGMNNRLSLASGLLGNTSNLYGQAGGAYQNAAQLGFGGANALVNLDPYQRALGTGVQLGSGIQGQSGQMIGNAFSNGQQLAGDVASFNQNMQGNLYNSYQNNQAAMYGAGLQANAALWGSAIGAVGQIGGAATGAGMMGAKFCWVAREVYGVHDPAWVEFRHWLLTRGSPRRVARYAASGPKIAAWIAHRPAWKARLRRWMDACRDQLS